MKLLILSLVIVAGLPAGQSNPAKPAAAQFTGVISDSMCAIGDHSRMRMGSTDAECTIACIDAHGAQYVLFDGKDAYTLSEQQTPDEFAGKKVIITGTLDARARTIDIDSIALAK